MKSFTFNLEDDAADRLSDKLRHDGTTLDQFLSAWLQDADRSMGFSPNHTDEENALSAKIFKRRADEAEKARLEAAKNKPVEDGEAAASPTGKGLLSRIFGGAK